MDIYSSVKEWSGFQCILIELACADAGRWDGHGPSRGHEQDLGQVGRGSGKRNETY